MIESRKFIDVDGLRTCYYEAGAGPTVVLLHGGEHGGCSEICWQFNFAQLARDFRVIAPDWLGYGKTAKVHDFESGAERRLNHMRRFIETLAIEEAHFVGSSMGGTLALKALSADPGFFPAASLTLLGAGGNSPDSAARRALIDYDCTLEGMRQVVDALFHDPKWANDADYVRRRHELSLEPGAWECAAAARLKNPLVPDRPDVGLIDTTPYDRLALPVLLIAGADDKIKQPGYADEVGRKLIDGEVHVIADCGHMPNIERASAVNDLLKRFVERVEGRSAVSQTRDVPAAITGS
jgi:2-hydroxymuconate-semialdehyde hydrolase